MQAQNTYTLICNLRKCFIFCYSKPSGIITHNFLILGPPVNNAVLGFEDPEPVGNGGRRGMVDHLPRCWPFIWASRKLGIRFRSPRDTDYSMLRTIIGPCLGKPSFAGAEFEVLRWWRFCCRLEGDKFGVAAPSVFPAKVYVFLAAQAAPANPLRLVITPDMWSVRCGRPPCMGTLPSRKHLGRALVRFIIALSPETSSKNLDKNRRHRL